MHTTVTILHEQLSHQIVNIEINPRPHHIAAHTQLHHHLSIKILVNPSRRQIHKFPLHIGRPLILVKRFLQHLHKMRSQIAVVRRPANHNTDIIFTIDILRQLIPPIQLLRRARQKQFRNLCPLHTQSRKQNRQNILINQKRLINSGRRQIRPLQTVRVITAPDPDRPFPARYKKLVVRLVVHIPDSGMIKQSGNRDNNGSPCLLVRGRDI